MKVTDPKKGEIAWINWVKIFCILFIYLNHSEIYCHSFLTYRTVYLPFFVNTFFIISGYLFYKSYTSPAPTNTSSIMENGKGKKLINNILFKLIIPSIIFSAINFFPKKVLRGEGIIVSDFLHDTVLGGSMWFTNALAIAELLLLVMLLLVKPRKLYFLIYSTTLALLSYLIYQSDTVFAEEAIPMFYKSGMSATLLMTLGGFYLYYEDQVDHWAKKWRFSQTFLPFYFFTFLTCILLLGYIYCCIRFFDYYSGALDQEPLNVTGILFIIASALLVITLCKQLPSTKFANYWGRHTIGLYFFCGAIPNVSAMILSKFMVPSVTMVLICTLLSLLLGYIIVYLLNRFVPWIFDLRVLRNNKCH